MVRDYTEGDYISLDGSTGNIYGGAITTVEPEISGTLIHLWHGLMKSEN